MKPRKRFNSFHKVLIAGCVMLVLVVATPALYLHATNLKNFDISMKISSFAYTGEKIAPEISVTNGNVELEEGEDYTVKYVDNEEVGKAKVIVEGKGPYRGKLTDGFKITRAKQSIEGKSSYKKNVADEEFNLKQDAKTGLTYKSSDESIATVDKDGTVTPVGEGTATISVVAEESKSYKLAEKEITVEVTETDVQKTIRGTLEWAAAIANDNSYQYGHSSCPKCHGGAKLYDCIAFAVASYWHGGQIESIGYRCAHHRGIDDCRAYMLNSSEWKSLGKISPSELQPGDMLYYHSNKKKRHNGWYHVEIYYGDGYIVGAHNRKEGISIRPMRSLSRYAEAFRYVGNE